MTTNQAGKTEFPAIDRRRMLGCLAGGFGSVGLATMLGESAAADSSPAKRSLPHHEPRAKRVIFLFMNGGPSQIDTFDPKPELARWEGKRLPVLDQNTNKLLGKPRPLGNAFPSPWKFAKHGECGMDVSELFPHVATHADDLCLIRSMCCDSFFHAQGTLEMMTGSGLFLRPSMGSWLTYGLGTENRNLPGFVVLGNVMGNVDATKVFSSAFLPAEFQGTRLPNLKEPIPNLKSPIAETEQRAQLDVMQQLNARHLDRRADTSALNARIEAFELAFRMQTVASDAFDITRETAATQQLYGLDQPTTNDYGQKCLLARRLVERGVRCVVVNHTDWDQHSNLLAGHAKNSLSVDQPIAGLLADLKQRGLLDDTLVIWGGEFGRTPNTEGKNGRDHNTAAFSMWLAGGGVKGGHIHGVTDEFGAYTTEGRTHVHDLHATILHLMGINHEQFTYRYSGRDYRLTDVFGTVVRDILA
ncbi:hypothetical protein ETAA8_22300 [Anatilimnocola aggregata]|uniref:DUF1501 domain-containing protein n=1 Tax=Anatilimnocola aggregata TaxID=2528021 RepID=A0A517YA90_9BACT|nr:DUF1501 domain-containing protein [Anatilimnocola aggregata]QDU27145.1 hypothetical protein ETAA8_22300 [Anatilimnocola aggregata]